jgi:hypothetical protein
MTYSRRQLYALGEPIGDSSTRKIELGRTIYGGGGGGGKGGDDKSPIMAAVAVVATVAVAIATDGASLAAEAAIDAGAVAAETVIASGVETLAADVAIEAGTEAAISAGTELGVAASETAVSAGADMAAAAEIGAPIGEALGETAVESGLQSAVDGAVESGLESVGEGAVESGVESVGEGAVESGLESVSPELDPTGSLAEQASSMNPYVQGALSGAGKGMATNAVVNTLNGRPITPTGLATSAALGGLGGAVSPMVNGYMPAGTNPMIPGAITGATVGATGAALTGGNPLTGAVVGGTMGGVTSGLTQPGVTGAGDPSLISTVSPTDSQLVNSTLLGAGLGGTRAAVTGGDIAGGLEAGAVSGALTNAGSQIKGGLANDSTPSTTQADTSNMLEITLADGTPGFLDPQTNVVFNANGTLNASATSAFNAPMPENNFYQTASVGNETPLVPNTGSKTLLTPDELTEYEAPIGSYFDEHNNIYGPDGGFRGMTVTPDIPPQDGTTLDDIIIPNTAYNNGSGGGGDGGLGGSNVGGDNTDGGGGGGTGTGTGGGGGLPINPIVNNTGGGENTVVNEGANTVSENVVTPPLTNTSLNIPTVPSIYNPNTTAPITSPLSTVTPTTKADTETSKPPTKPPTLEAGLTQGSQIALPFSQYNIPLVGTGATTRANGGSIGSNPTGVPMEMPTVPGSPEGHNPQFFSEGGLSSIQHRYVTGDGDGTSDSIPAMLANGEFVIPADVVSSLGNGSNDSGAKVLDEFLETIRKHKQKHGAKQLPPDSKGALGYLLEAKNKART